MPNRDAMQFRPALKSDVPAIAAMNLQLIRDSGHRNRMTVAELGERMTVWLGDGHNAMLFEEASDLIGYALYRVEPEWIYVRQFFVKPEYRRQGIGRRAVAWLFDNVWRGRSRIRLDVLIGNQAGIAFWQAIGFEEYSITMEREATRNPE